MHAMTSIQAEITDTVTFKFAFFTSSAHQKFKALAPEKVGHNKNAKLPMAKILQYSELRVNPFGDRICCIFSSSHDGDCTFEDFLDMMSVFSDGAPKAVKAEHAFRIFGNIS
jgi:calcium and integrin-binding protein 1